MRPCERSKMDRSHVHVAILGAGPSGCASALALSDSTADVIVLEKAVFPRDKTCGDGIGPRAISMLTTLGVAHEHLFSCHQQLDGVILSSPSRCSIKIRTREDPEIGKGYVVPRKTFDALLIQEVRRRGVVVREGFYVTHVDPLPRAVLVHGLQDGRPFQLTADAVIVSWGAMPGVQGITREYQHNLRDYAVAVRAYFEGLQGLEAYMAIHFDEKLVPGYGWVFPTGPESANIGYGIRADILKKKRIPLRQLYQYFVTTNPFVKALFGGRMQRTSSLRGAIIPFRRLRTPLVRGRMLFVGDAAGLADPLTGEGIGNALLSGWLAGVSVKEALRNGRIDPKALCAYRGHVQRHLQTELFCGNVLQRFLLNPKVVRSERLLDAFIHKASQNPKMARAMARLIIGDLPRNVVLKAEVWKKLLRAWVT